MTENSVFIGKAENPQMLNLGYADRHGLIACFSRSGARRAVRIVSRRRR